MLIETALLLDQPIKAGPQTTQPGGDTFFARTFPSKMCLIMIATRQCTFRLDGDGIVIATMKDGARFELADAVEAVAATAEVTVGTRRPVLVDMRGVQSESKDARAYFGGSEMTKLATAIALLVGSPVSRVIANFFIRIGAQPVPTRVFDDPSSARTWLRSHQAS